MPDQMTRRRFEAMFRRMNGNGNAPQVSAPSFEPFEGALCRHPGTPSYKKNDVRERKSC